MSDVSGVTNLIPTVNEGYITTIASPGISAGATTVPLANVAALTDATIFVGIVEPGQTNQQVFTGTVDKANSRITGVKWTRGGNVAHTTGVTVVDYVTGTAVNMIGKAFLNQHDQQGAHTAVTASTVVTTSNVTVGGNLNVTGGFNYSGTIRPNPRTTTVTTTATLTPNPDTYSIYDVTAQNGALTIANPGGTPKNGDVLIIRLKDDGTTRAISYGANYVNISGLANLTATTAGKWHVLGIMYNSTTTNWQIVSITTGA